MGDQEANRGFILNLQRTMDLELIDALQDSVERLELERDVLIHRLVEVDGLARAAMVEGGSEEVLDILMELAGHHHSGLAQNEDDGQPLSLWKGEEGEQGEPSPSCSSSSSSSDSSLSDWEKKSSAFSACEQFGRTGHRPFSKNRSAHFAKGSSTGSNSAGTTTAEFMKMQIIVPENLNQSMKKVMNSLVGSGINSPTSCMRNSKFFSLD
eukprot:GDKJ01058907.1.p1 GENE.GDKJ01058907.1~~GDKJ01058907.1.p1  ORF type:complete len:210 (+),score=55.54 GDKJ01058907.1:1-630(+)